MKLHDFRNGLRILYSLDSYEIGDPKWWPEFRDDPYRFLMACDGGDARVIWRAMIKRGLKSYDEEASN